MYDIFISYSHEDIAFADKVCKVLDEYAKYYKISYFIDRSRLKVGSSYFDRISEAIVQSKAVLFLASKNSFGSEFCFDELSLAKEERIAIYRYNLDSAKVPVGMKLLFANLQYLDSSTCPIEEMITSVLSNILNCEVKPLSEMELKAKKPQRTTKRGSKWLGWVVGVVAVVALLFGAREAFGYKVGDCYDDGEKQGVVFDVDITGLHGKIVSFDQAEQPWCTDTQLSKEVVTGASSETDGMDNSAKVLARSDAEHYSAFVWCRNKGKSWYLPAIEELELLLLNDQVRLEVNRTLSDKGAIPMADKKSWACYWSSTECWEKQPEYYSWHVDMYNANSNYGNKNNFYYYVRAVAKF